MKFFVLCELAVEAVSETILRTKGGLAHVLTIGSWSIDRQRDIT